MKPGILYKMKSSTRYLYFKSEMKDEVRYVAVDTKNRNSFVLPRSYEESLRLDDMEEMSLDMRVKREKSSKFAVGMKVKVDWPGNPVHNQQGTITKQDVDNESDIICHLVNGLFGKPEPPLIIPEDKLEIVP